MPVDFSIRNRKFLEELEEKTLAPWGCRSAGMNASRLHPEEEHPLRTNFQRDRDRIIHSRAFRRLKHKRQVFLITTGDHYRTRLTHTIEVVQLSRTIARNLGLNEDLTEAIALAHDLGHTPFGHIGEVVLHKILSGRDDLEGDLNGENIGGFKHNYQSVRVVDCLEKKYRFDGLNLTLPTREGILKHTRMIPNLIHYPNISEQEFRLNLPCSSTLEGQVVAICDEIAQRTHDLEDGLRAGFVTVKDVRALPIVQFAEEKILQPPQKEESDFEYIGRLIKKLINLLVTNVIEHSLTRIREYYAETGHFSPFDQQVIQFSTEIDPLQEELDGFIMRNIIKRKGIEWADNMAVYVIRGLFRTFLKKPGEMQSFPMHKYFSRYLKREDWTENLTVTDLPKRSEFVRLVADYIAGMTDHFAMKEFERLVGV